MQPALPRPRPPAWPALLAYVVAFVLALAASALLVFGVAWVRASGRWSRLEPEASRFALSAAGLMASALVDAGVLAVVTVCSALLQGKEIVARLRLGPTRATAVGMTSAVVGMIGLSFACGAASELIGVRGGGVMDTLARALQSLSPGQFAIALVTIGLAPGLAEETFFRGLIQTQLAARWGRWPAIVAASFGFALIHLDPVQGALAFFAGLYLGWLVERFGSIRASIVAHASNNMIFVTIGVFGGGGSSTRRGALAVAAIGAAMWASCMTVLRSRVAVSGDVTAPGGSATEAR